MIKLGLIGVGYLGSRHLRHLCSLDGVEVSGVWDTDAEKLSAAAKAYNVPVASSMADLIERSDGLVVVTTTSTHYEVGMQVVNAGKQLFVEKPLCATAVEGRALVDAAQARGVGIQVGHIERYNRAFRGLMGIPVRPRFIEVHRLAPWNPRGVDVAVVFDLMIHDLDLILSLTASEPVEIHANGVGVISDTPDIATARIRFADGMVANMTASRISLKKMRKLRLFGEREYISLDLAEGRCEYVGATLGDEAIPSDALSLGVMETADRRREVYVRFLGAEEADAMRLELTDFRDLVANGVQPPVTGPAGLRALDLAERIVRIIQEQQ